jgi:hypothetical protein
MAGEAVKGDDATTTTNEYNFTERQVTSRSLESRVWSLKSEVKSISLSFDS